MPPPRRRWSGDDRNALEPRWPGPVLTLKRYSANALFHDRLEDPRCPTGMKFPTSLFRRTALA